MVPIGIPRCQNEIDAINISVSERMTVATDAGVCAIAHARFQRPRHAVPKFLRHPTGAFPMIPSLLARMFIVAMRRPVLGRFMLLFALSVSPWAHAAGNGTVVIGVNNWAENIAVANLWKALLTEKGYDVTLQPGDKAIIYNGVAQGKLDLTFEVWLPSADGPPYDAIKSRVEKIGPWFPRAQLGLAVPDYVAIDSIDQLNANAAQFSHDGKPTIFGIEPGSGLMKLTGEARTAYALDATVLPSSEAAMLLALERAAKRRQPIVVTLWNPHWVWAKYPMHYLKDPKQVYGQPDAIYAIAKSGFGRAHPDVARWLGAWKMDDQTLGSLMNDIRANGESDPQKGVARWIASNRTRVGEWLR
ncbi:glycine betaine ABC transporter substrate-binding protein [Burkholderia contaminans]|uniref:glycine betaine ABC transporter substrate-binding protein n=2 Tax=Burkholderia contaminans TaxID=488447 RepID=UPI001CF1540D|nr:glycine betaine ABC transporter substrate-binding protein [Burkholderia contaminans]MCA7914015.1 glycine betaine ABC transporter substrate-binding protein [Burkholderia contaminans]